MVQNILFFLNIKLKLISFHLFHIYTIFSLVLVLCVKSFKLNFLLIILHIKRDEIATCWQKIVLQCNFS